MKGVLNVLYLDNAATTKMYSSVKDEMINAMELFGNPSSVTTFGVKARNQIEKARAVCAASIKAKPGEIYFTSGGTEADNWAVFSGMKSGWDKGRRLFVTSEIEHKAILSVAARLHDYGAAVEYVPVNRDGVISLDVLEDILKSNSPAIVSIMMVNNEVGTIQPIRQVAELCHKYGTLCHTDAVQAYGKIEVDVNDLGVDMLSVSAHKIHGAKVIDIGLRFLANIQN